jgi:hypothetical protein
MTIAPETRVTNSFMLSLNLGFRLNEEEVERVAEVMRSASVYTHMEVIIPPKMNTPSTKGFSLEEKRRVRTEVDTFNAERVQKVEEFFGKFLPDTTASLLASRLKGNVEGLVVLHCPRDRHFTLLVEHS